MCAALESGALSAAPVAAAARDFVCVKYIMGADSLPLPRRFPEFSVPVLWFLDQNQNDLGRQDGPHGADETTAKMKEALDLFKANLERVVWIDDYREGLKLAQTLIRSFMVVAYYPGEGIHPLDDPAFKDPEVARRSKRLVCIALDCEKDRKQAAWFHQKKGTKVYFINPGDRIQMTFDAVPEKDKMLLSIDESVKQFDEWCAQQKANRKPK